MIKILDLFAGTQSVRKAFPDCDYIGIDIYSPEGENLILDLTENYIISKLLNLLPQGWKPDFIWASPLCTPFSRATSIKNGTLSFEVINGNLKLREDFSYITHKAYIKHINDPEFQKKHQDKGRLGLKLFENTKEIIDYFKVPFVIENPAMAVSKYIMKDYVKNDCNYCMYGFDYKKSTSIYTNKKLDLKKCNHKGNHKMVMSGDPVNTGIKAAPSDNKQRSAVPPQLIKDIINQIIKENKND